LIDEMLMIRPEPRLRMPLITGCGHGEHGIQVGGHHRPPLVEVHLVEHAVAGDAGVVDQNFDRAEFALHLGNAGSAGVRIGDVPLVNVNAGLGLEGLGLLGVAGICGRHGVAGVFQAL
jgi:hypothetical protein